MAGDVVSADPAADTRRWHQTARICAPAGPPLWPWLFAAAVALWVILRVGCAGASEMPPARCPTWDRCWQADAQCERTPMRAWKPCRRVVRACFRDWERC